MLGMRYEKYGDYNDGLPFFLNIDITRTSFIYSRDQNWHEEPELQLCTSGGGTVLIKGEQYDFRPGDIVAVEPGLIHYTSTEGILTYTCLIISANFFRQVDIDCDTLQFEPHFRDEEMASKLRELCRIFQGTDPCRIAKLSELLLSIIIGLAERHSVSSKTTLMPMRSMETVKAAVHHIREHYNQKLTLDILARAVCTDKYVLCREFRHFTGETIVTYINHFRCIMAKNILVSGRSVAETAQLCGFENPSFFTRTFKKHMGVLPSKIAKHPPG